MKKIVILLVVVIYCSKTFSQESKMTIGLELSPSIAWLRGNSMSGTVDMRFSYSSGLTTEYFFNSQISLKSGLSYERKGSKTAISMTDNKGLANGTMHVSNNYDYLILPVLASYSTKGEIKEFFNVGPYFGYLISQKTISSSYDNYPTKTIDNSANTKKIDFGLSLGCGMSIPVGDKFLFDLGFKGNFGFINTSKKETNDHVLTKTNSFGLLIGLKYRI